MRAEGNPDERHASTSFAERQNLTMRMHMRRFTRLTNGFSKKVEAHANAVALHFLYYNFVRIHASLRVSPAMASGVTDKFWEMADIVALVEANEAEKPVVRGSYKKRVAALIDKAKQWAKAAKRDVLALWRAARDSRVPWYAKAVAGAVAAYALSPIDLIPDFIPVLGYLDDLFIVPFGILLAVKLVPADLMAEFRAEAIRREKPTSRAGLAVIVALWIFAAVFLAWLFWPS